MLLMDWTEEPPLLCGKLVDELMLMKVLWILILFEKQMTKMVGLDVR